MIIKKIVIDKQKHLEGLTELAQPVKELYYLGDLKRLLQRPLVAIVGSRKVSPYGQNVTYALAQELARAGVVIVSGLALGVDSIAHRGAIDAGGQTIAVLPSGLDYIYPRSHHNLASAIVHKSGALVSEYPTGQGQPMKHQFIARNRIIAALSQAIIITEAAAKSGSLHTANFALEQGIEVFAVPGNITSPNSAGSNKLIQEGASPVLLASDVLSSLHIQPAISPKYKPASAAEKAILELLQQKPDTQEHITQQAAINARAINEALTTLELFGAIRQINGLWHIN